MAATLLAEQLAAQTGPVRIVQAPRRVRRTTLGPRPAVADVAELAARSNFTFPDGASHPEELGQAVQALGLLGMSITKDAIRKSRILRFAIASAGPLTLPWRPAAPGRTP
jgi:hypothetical protein